MPQPERTLSALARTHTSPSSSTAKSPRSASKKRQLEAPGTTPAAKKQATKHVQDKDQERAQDDDTSVQPTAANSDRAQTTAVVDHGNLGNNNHVHVPNKSSAPTDDPLPLQSPLMNLAEPTHHEREAIASDSSHEAIASDSSHAEPTSCSRFLPQKPLFGGAIFAAIKPFIRPTYSSLVDPLFFSRERTDDEIRDHLGVTDCEILQIPLWHDDHWHLGLIWPKRKEFTIYEPLHNIPRQKWVRDKVGAICHALHGHDYSFIPGPEQPIQRDNYNCGILVAIVAISFALNKPLRATNADLWRLCFYTALGGHDFPWPSEEERGFPELLHLSPHQVVETCAKELAVLKSKTERLLMVEGEINHLADLISDWLQPFQASVSEHLKAVTEHVQRLRKLRPFDEQTSAALSTFLRCVKQQDQGWASVPAVLHHRGQTLRELRRRYSSDMSVLSEAQKRAEEYRDIMMSLLSRSSVHGSTKAHVIDKPIEPASAGKRLSSTSEAQTNDYESSTIEGAVNTKSTGSG